MTRLAVLVLLALVSCAPPAFAWGALGHRLVGSLAQDELTPAARRELDLLLKGEAEPTLAGIATWADELRANDPGLGRRSAPWHYVNLAEDNCTYVPSRDCAKGNCLVEAIRAQTAILADRRRTVAERRQALKFVVHFIGDVHQPLHAAHAHDKGGNEFQVNVAGANGKRRGTNLHSLWDSGLIEATGRSEAQWLRHLRAMPLAVSQPRNPLPPPAARWAIDACRIATSPGFYPAQARLGPEYPQRWLPTVEAQLRRGASHLAAVLNAALATPRR